MTREQWKAKYREWRVQDRVWKELQASGAHKRGDGVPAFVTWEYKKYEPTRKFGDTLSVFPYDCQGTIAGTHRVRMNHLHKHVRLPA